MPQPLLCLGLALLMLGLLLAGGCGAKRNAWEDYQWRIANLLGEDAELAERVASQRPNPILAFPKRRDLMVSVPAQGITIAQFARLHRCDLGDLVGQRNSSLGRVQPASQELAQDLLWLQRGPQCVAQGERWLKPILEQKSARLEALFWNSVVADAGFARAFTVAAVTRNGSDAVIKLSSLLRDLLDHLTALGDGKLDVHNLQATMSQLVNIEPLGATPARWHQVHDSLGWVSARLNNQRLRVCRNRQPTPQLANLQRVFEQVYIAQLQPALAVYHREEQQVAALLDQLRQRLSAVATREFMRWYTQSWDQDAGTSQLQRTEHAIREHALAWQALWNHCRLDGMP